MLNATDRCDGCGAQAYVVTTINDVDLMWCVHHWTRSEHKLVMLATRIRDYSFLLLEKER